MVAKNSIAKTLSSNQVKKSLDNSKPSSKSVKKKKTFAKNCLDDPFAIEWPIQFKNAPTILKLLKESMASLNVSNLRPSLTLLQDVPKNKRREFRKEYKEKASKELNPEVIQARKELTVGYNAVMRGIEKDRLVCVFVDSGAKPEFLVKMFHPLCSVKRIPLLPLKHLSDLVGGLDMLGVKRCLAIGLGVSVLKEDSRFHTLYLKSCQALGMKSIISSNDSLVCRDAFISKTASHPTNLEMEKVVECNVAKENISVLASIPTRKQILAYHLKKPILGRAFKPTQNNDFVPESTDYLSFGLDFASDSDITSSSNNMQSSETKRRKIYRTAINRPQGSIALSNSLLKDVSIKDMFAIDVEGEDLDCNVETGNKEDKKEDEVLLNISKRKVGSRDSEYVSAKIQKVKGDPERKIKIKNKRADKKKAKRYF